MITFIPIGEVTEVEALWRASPEVFGQKTCIGKRMPLLREGWNQTRRQYLASSLLALLPFSTSIDRALGVTDVDLYAPGLNFVFGQSDVDGARALVSFHRLRQEFYGLPRNQSLFLGRAVKEVVHELGHTYGLHHCPNPSCVMRFSNSIRDTDRKSANLCPDCQIRFHQKI